jgi:hypothetical protein
MSRVLLAKGQYPERLLRPTVAYIARCQKSDGAIPWFPEGPLDPWDHLESAMGLAVGGALEAARAAFAWLEATQREDGSWPANFDAQGQPTTPRAESNFVAYVATGVCHYVLCTGDDAFAERYWPMVRRALAWVLTLQGPAGDIAWARDEDGAPCDDALVTGCASIYKSLECAIDLAQRVGDDPTAYLAARSRLGEALRHRPERFDRTWESKARFSMDWFYPVLTGVLTPDEGKARLAARWDEFVEPGLGCRCVADQPWVTIAESCELTLALLATGQRQRAAELFSWLHDWRSADGAYWTGYQFAEKVLWPEEQPTWTAGAVLLAADALTETTGAARLLTGARALPAFRTAQAQRSR